MNMNDMLAFTIGRTDAEKCIFSIAGSIVVHSHK